MKEWPVCTFHNFCIYNRSKQCTILEAMPKPRKDDTCPFAKRHPGDIAWKAPLAKKKKKGAENEPKAADSIWHNPDPAEPITENNTD